MTEKLGRLHNYSSLDLLKPKRRAPPRRNVPPGGAPLRNLDTKQRKTSTQTHGRPPGEALLLQTSAGAWPWGRGPRGAWPGWWEGGAGPRSSGRTRAQENQKNHVRSGSAGRSHCERVIKTAVGLSRWEGEVARCCFLEGASKQRRGPGARAARRRHFGACVSLRKHRQGASHLPRQT